MWRLGPPHPDHGRIAATVLIHDVFALLADRGAVIEDVPEGFADRLADVVALRAWGILSARHSRAALAAIWDAPGTEVIDWLLTSKALEEADEGELRSAIETLMAENEGVCAQIRGGKASAVGFFVGQAMKRMRGKADPVQIKAILDENLDEKFGTVA
jgi:aspartyl-tRNA(Asn)/glutamyl-tRNA(Gln) amidotransferase subunit B